MRPAQCRDAPSTTRNTRSGRGLHRGGMGGTGWHYSQRGRCGGTRGERLCIGRCTAREGVATQPACQRRHPGDIAGAADGGRLVGKSRRMARRQRRNGRSGKSHVKTPVRHTSRRLGHRQDSRSKAAARGLPGGIVETRCPQPNARHLTLRPATTSAWCCESDRPPDLRFRRLRRVRP